MARLNDPPVPPAESLDALKRRFIRQNREIARVNSTQSQRIRNLETEISRLLSENIALREQAIAAAAQAEKWRLTSRLGRDVVDLKSRLETKLSEVNALVEELGSLPEKAARRSSFRRRKSGFGHDLAGSPDEKDWRNRQTLGASLSAERDGQDGRLPAIMEDKYYPRRTLETEELRILTAAANTGNEDTESPELGPPPVAHFEVAESISFDSAKSPKRVSGGIVPNDEEPVPILKNLESRRKRRTSSLLQDMSSLQDGPEDIGKDVEGPVATGLKSNVKRKFDASDMVDDTAPIPQHEDFEYARRNTTAMNRPKGSRFTTRLAHYSQGNQPEEQAPSPQKTLQGRRALAPKSTNSPTKKPAVVSAKHEIVEDIEKDTVRSRVRAPVKPNLVQIAQSVVDPVNGEVEDIAYAPKTPAPPLHDIFSPPSSAIDTAHKPKSTEAAITASVEDVLNGSIGRGSRRAKAAVSYAEPNLRDKMRRPDKKLVGALEGINKASGTSESRDETNEKNSDSGQGVSGMRVVKIKSEKKSSEEEKWRDLAEAGQEAEVEVKTEVASPLQDKQNHALSKINPARKKRTFSESEGTRSKRKNDFESTDDELNKVVSRLSIYDAPDSSPVSEKVASNNRLTTNPKPQPTSSHDSIIPVLKEDLVPLPTTGTTTARSRRHSVQPRQTPNSNSSAPLNHPSTTSIRPNSSVSVSTRDRDRDRDLPTKDKENINIHPSTSKLKRPSSVQILNQATVQPNTRTTTTTTETGVPAEKSLGTRRRSMMI